MSRPAFADDDSQPATAQGSSEAAGGDDGFRSLLRFSSDWYW
jgi:hypothetical protein